MASTEDMLSKTQMSSFDKILNSISAAAPDYPELKLRLRLQDEESGCGSLEKRGLLYIDLNVAPPEEPQENGGDGREITPTAEEVEIVEGGEKRMECGITVTASEKLEREEMETRENVRWVALLEVGDEALRDYEESVMDQGGKSQNRRRRHSRGEVEISGELQKGTAARKKTNGRRTAERWNEAAEFVEASSVVVRSTRGRAVAMPNKYRDSVIHVAAAVAVAEARFSRLNEKRKSR